MSKPLSGELLPGVRLQRLQRLQDARGDFVKTYGASTFDVTSAEAFIMREEFYSTSARDVVRGMHLQIPPHEHTKVVCCVRGAVLDVLLDLRRGPGYGRLASVRLSSDEPAIIVIPVGIAHGFRSLVDDTVMVYKTNSEHSPTHDVGIRWDSIGFDWGISNPLVSPRDAAHPELAEFASPF
jgi:dTDP-4-dehydrorhamnose 3,5-epimerase/CDP-3, 6-dideoxy-D-glycero-D-glycero-4-hexulose-5-epimerase